MANYTMDIYRTGNDKGTLMYRGSINYSCDCWWDPTDKILPGTYLNCSKTFLDTKKNSTGGKREGIYFPNVLGRKGIFIHYWPGPPANLKVWSDGCTLLFEPDMLKIWGDIQPLNGKNVKIAVADDQCLDT